MFYRKYLAHLLLESKCPFCLCYTVFTYAMKALPYSRNQNATWTVVPRRVLKIIAPTSAIRMSNNVCKWPMATLKGVPCGAKLGCLARKCVPMGSACFLAIKAKSALKNVMANTVPRHVMIGTAPANKNVSLETARWRATPQNVTRNAMWMIVEQPALTVLTSAHKCVT